MSNGRGRSGCALVSGLFLIVVGAVLLAHNLFGLSLLRVWTASGRFLAVYWPAILIIWGAWKLYQRAAAPERARVSAFEIVLLLLVIGVGLGLDAAWRLTERMSNQVPWNEVAELVGPEIWGPAHTFVEEQSYELSTVQGLSIENTLGSVTATGWSEPRLRVIATKQVYHRSESEAERLADEVGLVFESGETEARLRPSVSHAAGAVRTHFQLWLPREISALSVQGRRGPMRVSDVSGAVRLSNEHEGVEVEDVHGPIDIRTSHGPIRVARVSGRVEARNRHGSVFVRQVEGDLIAETTSSEIHAEDVSGTLTITGRRGSVRVVRAGGNATIDANQAEVSVEEAGGDVGVTASHRSIFVSGVSGSVAIQSRNASVVARGIRGDLGVDNVHERTVIGEVDGSVRVKAENSEVTAENVGGPCVIESSYGQVSVSSFGSTLEVRARHAPLTVATSRLDGAVRLETSYEPISLALPPGASVSIEARTRDGELATDFPQLERDFLEEESNRFWSGTVGGGAHQISLSTSYADIAITEGRR